MPLSEAAVMRVNFSSECRMIDISVNMRPLVSAKYAKLRRPIFGNDPAILPRSHAAVPFPSISKRLKPGRSKTPTSSLTA